MSDEVTEILTERNKTHGDFADCARVSQAILRAMRSGRNWETMSDVHREAIQVIALKLHRIACGDPDHEDHFVDIAGYAQLVLKYLRGKKSSG